MLSMSRLRLPSVLLSRGLAFSRHMTGAARAVPVHLLPSSLGSAAPAGAVWSEFPDSSEAGMLVYENGYYPESVVGRPSDLSGIRPGHDGRDPQEIIADLEGTGGLYEETGISKTSDLGMSLPLRGLPPSLDGLSLAGEQQQPASEGERGRKGEQAAPLPPAPWDAAP